MKRREGRFNGLRDIALVILVLSVTLERLLPAQETRGDSDRHVVIVCIDGFAAYLLNDRKAPVPTIRKLAAEGAVAEGGMRVPIRQ